MSYHVLFQLKFLLNSSWRDKAWQWFGKSKLVD